MNLVDLITNKNLKEANVAIHEKMKEIVEAKLVEVRKMIAARQFNENRSDSGNSDDSHRIYNYHGDNMKAFDSLPKAVRQSLANADHNWSAGQVKKGYRKAPQLKDIFTVIQTIKDQDAKKHNTDVKAGMTIAPGQR